MWHSLNAGNVRVAVDLLEFGQKQAVSFPAAVLRAVLAACSESGYSQKAEALFQELKQRRVYNAEPLVDAPYVFQLSTLLTPAEARFCILDRLKEVHGKLLSTVAQGSQLGCVERGLAVQVVSEHDPHLLALPFLALAPRSLAQALSVLTRVMEGLTPPIHADFNQSINLLVVRAPSLIAHLNTYTSSSSGQRQELTWEDGPQQSSPPSPPQPVPPSRYKPVASTGRQTTGPPAASGRAFKPPGHPEGRVAFAPPCPERRVPTPLAPALSTPRPLGSSREQPASKVPVRPFTKPGDSVMKPFSQAKDVGYPPPRGADGVGREVGSPPPHTTQPSHKPSGTVRPHLPFHPPEKRTPALPAVSDPGRQMSVPAYPRPQPGDSDGRQFKEPQGPPHLPLQPPENKMPASPAVSTPGRQLSMPGYPRPQPGREMKRRLSTPPEHQPAGQNKPLKVPLLPTPQFPPVGHQSVMPAEESLQELPPKMMKPSPPERPFVETRRDFQESYHAEEQQRFPPTSAPNMSSSQSLSSRTTLILPPPSRETPQPSSRYGAPERFSGFPSQSVEQQRSYSSRGGRHTPPQSEHRGHQPPCQTFQEDRQPPQQFPGETESRPAYSSGMDMQFTGEFRYGSPPLIEGRQQWPEHTRQDIGRRFPEEPEPFSDPCKLFPDRSGHLPQDIGQQFPEDPEPVPAYAPSGELFPKRSGHLPHQSMQQNRWQSSPQNIHSTPLSEQNVRNIPMSQQQNFHVPLSQESYQQNVHNIPMYQESSQQNVHVPMSQESSQQNANSTHFSQMQATGDARELPAFPSRGEEWAYNSSTQTRSEERMSIPQDINQVRDHSWQGANSSYNSQRPGAEPWGDAPLYGEREEVSRQMLVDDSGFAPREETAQPGRWSEDPSPPFRCQDRFSQPRGHPGQVRGPRPQRGRQSFRARHPQGNSFRQTFQRPF